MGDVNLAVADDEWAKNCILCKQSMKDSDTVNVKAQGIKGLIKASKQRGDAQVGSVLQNCSEIKVHKACSKTYNTKVALKKLSVDSAKSQASPPTRTSRTDFNFENNCLFCERILLTKKSNASTISYVNNTDYKKKLLQKYANQTSPAAIKFKNRISFVPCLVQVNAAYHRNCQKYPPFLSKATQAHDQSRSSINDIIVDYIASKPDKAQFTLSEILQGREDIKESPFLPSLKYKLQSTLNCEFIVQVSKADIVISRTSLARMLLLEHFEKSMTTGSEKERLQKVYESSAICLRDIQCMEYNMNYYPAQDKFLDDSNKLVPQTLHKHLFNIIAKDKKKPNDWNDVINSICHAIIAATRPSSFVSPVLVNIACVLHRMFASKDLIDLLHANGFCASYKEVRRYLSSVISSDEEFEYNDGFSQLVYDNADHNVETIDGRGTLHVMGGIQIITPKSAISEGRAVPRLKQPLTAEQLAKYGKIEMQHFRKKTDGGFKNVAIQNIDKIHVFQKDIKLSELDFLWTYGRSVSGEANYPGFRGFMENVTTNDPFQISKIKILPFINAPASDLDTIYTSLFEAEKLRVKLEQEHMFVTYDSPLFWKGQEVETHFDFERIIVRLGCFHLLFSYNSSTAYVMNGSGLREVFCLMYAENSCDKVLNGTAYTRSIRANLIVHAALGKLIMDECDFNNEEKTVLNNVLSTKGPQLLQNLTNPHFQSAYQKFHDKLDVLETRGPTAQLWVLYFKLLTLEKLFLDSERSGNFALHLQCCHRMLPVFIATGHFHYVKCLLLYLQQMVKLCNRLIELQTKPNKSEKEKKELGELDRYINQGFFTVRRTDKFWSGCWSDMMIEQTLMRLMKIKGGLTHGRGVTPSLQAQWTLATPALADMSGGLQAYSNVNFATSEQHKDSRPSRMKRDLEDYLKVVDFFKKNDPFPYSGVPTSLSTGIMGDIDETLEVGNQLLRDLLDSTATFDKIKFSRKKLVRPLQAAAGKIVAEGEEIITANPSLIWHRVTAALNVKQNLDKYLSFELAPYPLALFDNGIMRKNVKSKFIDHFQAVTILPSKVNYIIDGGHLLLKVVWPHDIVTNNSKTYADIAKVYVDYLQRKYHDGSEITVVFDGYENTGTKSAERIRRKTLGVCSAIDVGKDTLLSKNQAQFFSNDENKRNFILLLEGELVANKIKVVQAREDADTLIVETAIEKTTSEVPSMIVGSDTDLLVILTQRTPLDKKVFFMKDVKGEMSYYDSNSFKHANLKSLVLFLHAFTGCDTTSAFFNQGKTKLVQKLLSDEILANKMSIFNNPNADKASIADAGFVATLALYGAKSNQNMSLNMFRYHCYDDGVKKFNTVLELKRLPPSESAIIMHSFRVYYQVQLWFGYTAHQRGENSEDSFVPTNWGWRFVNNMYKPIFVEGKLLPDELIKSIRCNCKKSCTGNCGCKKHGLKCSDYCGHCKGLTCDNKQEMTDLPDEMGNVDDEQDLGSEVLMTPSDEQDITYDIPTRDDVSDNDESSESECEGEIDNVNSPQAKRRKLE